MNGLETVHLPKIGDTLNLRLFFATPTTTTTTTTTSFNLEGFDKIDKRVARLELIFMLGHLQINWNGLQSSWQQLPIQNTNHLELSITRKLYSFKLNGKSVQVSIEEPRIQAQKLVIYEEGVEADSDFLEILEDDELLDSLEMAPIWQNPIKLEQLVDDTTNSNSSNSAEITLKSIDYLVYDSQSISRLQISINAPLPKLEVISQKTKSKSLFASFKDHLLAPFKSSKSTALPVLHKIKKDSSISNDHIFGSVVISAFIIYLAILLKLSRMTSIRASTKKRVTNNIIPDTISTVSSPTKSITKSSSQSKLNLDFSDAPHLKSSFSANGSVLKVTIPAALSISDNRHILFPSKLRNFQK